MLGGDSKLLAEVLQLLLSGTPAKLEALGVAIKAGDGPQVAKEAHLLKGSFLTVGAGSLVSAFEDLISLGDRSDLVAIEPAYREALGNWERLKGEVVEFLERSGKPNG